MTFIGKIKLIVLFGLLLMVLAFVGCRPVLQAKYVSSESANENMVSYISEVEKLMNDNGYIKSTNIGEWTNIYQAVYLDVYELDDNTLFVFGTNWYEGEESFFINVLSLNDKHLDKSNVYLSLVSKVLTMVSGYSITEEYLDKFCDNAKYDDKSGNYVNDLNIDRSGYYDLSYITRQNGSVVHESMGEYNTFLMVRGLTKNGLKKTGDGSLC